MKICQSYEKAHKEIRLFREKKRGMGDARNTGLKRATGKYICFVDADDYIEKTFLEDMLNNSKNSLLFKTSLKELLDKSDFSVLDSFKSKSKSEQKIILEELRKYKDNNNQEIKGLEEYIKNLEEMFNKD